MVVCVVGLLFSAIDEVTDRKRSADSTQFNGHEAKLIVTVLF